MIAILDVEDPAFVHQAAKRGVFAYVTTSDARDEQLESSIDVVLARFAEFHALEGAFGRRALTERAKGILMERHSVDEDVAFLMLRDQSRKSNRKLIDVAQAVLEGRALLPDNSARHRRLNLTPIRAATRPSPRPRRVAALARERRSRPVAPALAQGHPGELGHQVELGGHDVAEGNREGSSLPSTISKWWDVRPWVATSYSSIAQMRRVTWKARMVSPGGSRWSPGRRPR